MLIFLLGAKVDPSKIEDVNFYKAKFGKRPPTAKLHPSPSVTEKFFGLSEDDKRTLNNFKLK